MTGDRAAESRRTTRRQRPGAGDLSSRWLGAVALAAWGVVLILLTAGCGYQTGANPDGRADAAGYQWQSLYRQDVRTVAVPIFTSGDFRRGVEFDLSKALVNQIEAQTPYKVVSRQVADTILEGEIVAVDVRRISRDFRTALPQEQLLTVTVNFTWKDLRTGQILVERRNFDQTATYYPTLGEGEFAGSQDAVERLARGIVQQLQQDW